VLISLLLTTGAAQAAELELHGHYRARGLLYDNLSLSNTNPNALDRTSTIDHRFRLQPGIHVSSRVSVYAQLDFLPLQPWGDQINTYIDPVTGEAIAMAWADGVQPSADADDGTSYLRNLSLTRVYADVYTPAGRLRFGRIPMDWGTGMWLNDGNDVLQEYGDTGDRLEFTSRVGPVYVMGAYELMHEGLVERTEGGEDAMQALDLAVAWQTETMAVGLYNRYRFGLNPGFHAYSGDLFAKIELGPAEIQAEVNGVFGRGDLDTGVNDISIIAVGAVLDANVAVDKIYGGVQAGLATGDTNPNDSVLRTYTFDRDHNIALMMFEEPMPILAPGVINDANGGRDYDAVRTGEGVSNALYARPMVGYQLRPDLSADVAGVFARALQVPDEQSDVRGYGMEYDLSVTYSPFEHFHAKGTGGVFVPGPYYAGYEHETLGGDFDKTTFGGRLLLTAEF
jgi:hypothetical protein